MRGPGRGIVAGACLTVLALTATGCHNAPWRREAVPPDRPYVSAPSSTASSEMSAPRVGFSTEPASNGFSAVGETPTAGGDQATPGFGSPGGSRDSFEGIPGLPGPWDQVDPGVMGQSGQGPSPL